MNSTFNDHHHLPKREPNENSGVGIIYPPSPSPLLKLNKDSHIIKKPPSPSSSSSTAAKPRQPVIIYTNTPKVIHTNPKDFMALVQKLTGMSHSEEDSNVSAVTDRGGKSINRSVSDLTVDRKVNRTRCTGGGGGGGGGGHNSYNRSYSGPGGGNGKGIFFNNTTICEDSESSSVITTDETYSSAVGVSPFPPPPPPPPPPHHQSMYDGTNGINYSSYFSTLLPAVNPADSFLCGNQNFANFDDPLYFMPNMRSSFSSSSSSGFDGLTEFRDF
ncbi:hypothetical protein N665_0229s0036 [Sinapis alba]|nr:hypothetical protein N665_0229s0036 [Sinapis alba]